MTLRQRQMPSPTPGLLRYSSIPISPTGNIDVDLLEQAIKDLRSDGKSNLPPVVLPVDLLGKCADYSALARVGATSTRHEDSLRRCGILRSPSCREGHAGSFGDAAVLSFNGNKVITTSGGGMLVRGTRRWPDSPNPATQAREAAIHYQHLEVGYNYRMRNVLAALGRAQLTRLDSMLGRVVAPIVREVCRGA